MADPSALMEQRWRSGRHIAEARPTCQVEYRTGNFKRRYQDWDGPYIGAFVSGALRKPGSPGAGNRLEWQSFWTPHGPFLGMPNVLDVSIEQNLDNNGIAVATIQVENIGYPQIIGVGGAFLSIERGYYAPSRGYHSGGRPPLIVRGQRITPNEWYDRFSHNGQVRILMGYGGAFVPVFTGLVDDIDAESHPDKIILTARDFGRTLTDQRVFGWNKEPRIMDPVIFMDRRKADRIKKVGKARASSSSRGHTAGKASIPGDSDRDFWYSRGHGSRAGVEWIELTLPEGRYEDFFYFPRYRGMDMYVSVYVTDRPGSLEPSYGNVGEPGHYTLPLGWHNVGKGSAPGGGPPIVHSRKGLDAKGYDVGLQGVYRLGPGSRIRVTMTNLSRRGDGQYHAGVNRLFGKWRAVLQEALKKHWILVDDISGMVRIVLRWAGFKEWEVEDTGVRLGERFVVARSNFYMDVIKHVIAQTGYQFFIKSPSTNPESLGVPVFRRPTVADPRVQPRVTVKDTDLLTGIQSKKTNEPLAYIIRVRGRTAKNSDGGRGLFGDRTKRVMYVYFPPWVGRVGGIVKHVVHTDNSFKTIDDCKFGAFFIALQEALEAHKVTFEMPLFPVELDSQIAVMDVGTGLTTRVWIAQRQLQFHRGEQTKAYASFGGAIVDNQDVAEVTAKINSSVRVSE